MNPVILSDSGQPGNTSPPNVTDAETPCPRCGCKRVALSWRPYGRDRRHIRASCTACGAWCYWAGHTPHTIALADAAGE